MNASYKIVLLGAFVVFAAVVGYYVFVGSESPEEQSAEEDAFAQQDETPESTPPAEPAPNPRPILEQPAPIEPATEPVVEEETIGESPDELPEPPLIAALDPVEEPLVREDPQPIGDPSEDPGSTDPAGTEEEIDGPGEEPAQDPDGTTEEVTEPGAEPEAEPETRPIPPAPGTIPRTYTVQAGDTFASIAEAFYGDERAWYDIAQANPSVDPKRLQIGQSIVLPNRDEGVREREEVQPPAPGNDQNYTVRPGDNLSRIAQRFYGDAEKWDLIYARNRNLIGPRPNDLKVGMELVIPQAYDGAE